MSAASSTFELHAAVSSGRAPALSPAEVAQRSPRVHDTHSPAIGLPAVVSAATAGTPTSTRSAHKPAVLSLSLRTLDADGYAEVPPSVSTLATGTTDAGAGAASRLASSQHNGDRNSGQPLSSSAVSSNQPSGAVQTRLRKAVVTSAPARASSPSIPLLHLPVETCKDEVTPVKTLYSRLFHEAQLREQRQLQAQRQQRAAQKAAEKEACTFHPRVADAAGRTPLGKEGNDAGASSSSSGGGTGAEVRANPPMSDSPSHRTPQRNSDTNTTTTTNNSKKRRVSSTSPTHLRSASTGVRNAHNEAEDAGTAACVRLYENAEQSQRRERRLQQLRAAQEDEFRRACTFHPCVSPTAVAGERSSSISANSNDHSGGHLCEPDQENGSRGAGDARNNNNSSSSAARGTSSPGKHGVSPRRPSRSWEDFLADQAEHQAVQARHLEALKKRAAEADHAVLFTGVPRSKASQHLRTFLEKKKGYKGPVEGWAERFEHYMKVKQAMDDGQPMRRGPSAARNSATPPPPPSSSSAAAATAGDGNATSPQAEQRTPRTAAAHATPRRKERGDSAGGKRRGSARSPSVFHRLYHDSDEREAMRELIHLMQEQHEQAAFYKPNAGERVDGERGRGEGHGGDASRQAVSRRSAAGATAAAVALAAAGGGDGGSEVAPVGDDAPAHHGDPAAPSIFDALYAEQEHLQRRRELQHVQAQNSAEVYSFHPHVSPHSRELVKEAARRKAKGEAEEGVRERRAREAAEAAAAEAARRASVQFRYDSFAHRQAERDRRRQEELLQVRLHGRQDDLEACRFRPALSEVTEAIVEGNCHYTQVIDNPAVAQALATSRRGSQSTSKNRGARNTTPRQESGGNTAGTAAVVPSSFLASAVSVGAAGHSISASHPKPSATPIEVLAATADDVDGSLDTRSVPHWHDSLSAPVGTHSVASSVSTEKAARRSAQPVRTRAPLPLDLSLSETPGQLVQSPVKAGSVETVHIAGAASSEYLRQLESELQDALRDWSQCV